MAIAGGVKTIADGTPIVIGMTTITTIHTTTNIFLL
jgi:hypothetical protein